MWSFCLEHNSVVLKRDPQVLLHTTLKHFPAAVCTMVRDFNIALDTHGSIIKVVRIRHLDVN